MQKRIKYSILLLSFFILPVDTFAQELNCNVQVVSRKIQGTNRSVFETLQQSIFEFMNNRNWTNHVYKNNERIECNILINITDMISSNEFQATFQVQSRRPVFDASYSTVLLNHQDDDFNFRYVEFEPLEFSESRFTSNLVGVLAYYAYIIIGMDYDSFSPEGGTEYFKKAENIVTLAQNANFAGWRSFENERNRYWLIENLLNEIFTPAREFMYQYHRQGLDVMSEDPAEGRAAIAESFNLLREVHRERPTSFLMQIIFNAKADEVVDIFSESFPQEKSAVHAILVDIDPANNKKYNAIISNN